MQQSRQRRPKGRCAETSLCQPPRRRRKRVVLSARGGSCSGKETSSAGEKALGGRKAASRDIRARGVGLSETEHKRRLGKGKTAKKILVTCWKKKDLAPAGAPGFSLKRPPGEKNKCSPGPASAGWGKSAPTDAAGVDSQRRKLCSGSVREGTRGPNLLLAEKVQKKQKQVVERTARRGCARGLKR